MDQPTRSLPAWTMTARLATQMESMMLDVLSDLAAEKAGVDDQPAQGADLPDTLPVVDISRLQGSARDRETLIAHLRSVLHRFGFFYLKGHGVDPALCAAALAVSKQFFALPDEDKLAIEMIRSPHFRGYCRAGMELTGGKPDWREQVDFDREEIPLPTGPDTPAWHRAIGPNQWPDALPEMRGIILAYQAEVTRVGIEVLRAIALALGQNEDAFAPMYKSGPRQHLKIVRYPGRDQTTSKQGVGAHKDGGLITILLQDVLPGLQVQLEDGSWIDAPPVPGTFVVNTGELLELATNGFVHADVHCATSPEPGTARYSIPFFLGASHEGSIPLIDLPPELRAVERGVSSDPSNPLFRDVGMNHLKARLRSHPDVAARFYADCV
ncbi:isopenicillin N synthase-like dioxygenase [Sphingobium sp. B1D7B]|nr:2-oxoglutarate and iron-dependent oxygenase domain-containing protein [Sphingobium sp. B1D7B]MCW2404506.1 isopenicillin N synthase-like dioxygenase [Sphingobium sp. B1D7B]